jgi:hypothetical protein
MESLGITHSVKLPLPTGRVSWTGFPARPPDPRHDVPCDNVDGLPGIKNRFWLPFPMVYPYGLDGKQGSLPCGHTLRPSSLVVEAPEFAIIISFMLVSLCIPTESVRICASGFSVRDSAKPDLVFKYIIGW